MDIFLAIYFPPSKELHYARTMSLWIFSWQFIFRRIKNCIMQEQCLYGYFPGNLFLPYKELHYARTMSLDTFVAIYFSPSKELHYARTMSLWTFSWQFIFRRIKNCIMQEQCLYGHFRGNLFSPSTTQLHYARTMSLWIFSWQFIFRRLKNCIVQEQCLYGHFRGNLFS